MTQPAMSPDPNLSKIVDLVLEYRKLEQAADEATGSYEERAAAIQAQQAGLTNLIEAIRQYPR